jgi:hypothetical protein
VPLLLCEGDEGHAEVKAALEAAGKAHVRTLRRPPMRVRRGRL